MYGNKEWGGIEFNLVTGTSPAKETHRTYADYDPVTGRALRNAIRQQVALSAAAVSNVPYIIIVYNELSCMMGLIYISSLL